MSGNPHRLPSFEDFGEDAPTGPREPVVTVQRIVEEYVTLEKFFTAAETRELLGGISKGTYYRLTRSGLLKFWKGPGGRRHTQQHIADFVAQMNAHSHGLPRRPPLTFPTRPGARRFK